MLQGGPKSGQRTLQNLASQLNPLLKAPLEAVSGVQMLSGRALEDIHSPTGSTALDQILMNSPLSRFATTGRQIGRAVGDEEYLPLGLRLGTGLGMTDVDVEKQKGLAGRELIDDLLKGRPGVRSFETVYIPKDRMAEASQEDIQLARLNRALQERMKREAAQRR